MKKLGVLAALMAAFLLPAGFAQSSGGNKGSGGSGLPTGCSASGNSLGACKPTSDVVPLTLKDATGGTANILELFDGGNNRVAFLSSAGAMNIGSAGSSGQIALSGSSSGTVTEKVQAAAGTYEWDLPITAGSPGQFLTSQGGAGTAMTWTTSSATASTWFQWGINPNGTLAFAATANHIMLWAFYVHGSLTYSKFAIQVVTGDGANSYDIGIYPYTSGASCSLRKHIGATTMGTTGYVEFALSGGGTDTLTDGWWVFASTGPAVTATLRYDGTNQFSQPFQPVNAGAGSDITGGGTTLPASITCPTQTFNASAGGASPIWLGLHN